MTGINKQRNIFPNFGHQIWNCQNGWKGSQKPPFSDDHRHWSGISITTDLISLRILKYPLILKSRFHILEKLIKIASQPI